MHYIFALFKEIVEMRDEPFSEIIARDPPAEFTQLWLGNVALSNNFQDPSMASQDISVPLVDRIIYHWNNSSLVPR